MYIASPLHAEPLSELERPKVDDLGRVDLSRQRLVSRPATSSSLSGGQAALPHRTRSPGTQLFQELVTTEDNKNKQDIKGVGVGVLVWCFGGEGEYRKKAACIETTETDRYIDEGRVFVDRERERGRGKEHKGISA